MDGTPIRKGVKALRNFASIGLATGGQTLPEEKAQTRYSEVTEKTVLLIRALHTDPVEKSTTVTLLDGKILTVPHSRHAVSLSTLRNISSALARQMITTLTARAPDPISVAKMKSYGLAHCMYVGNDDSHHSAVSIGFVTESGRISNSNDKYESFYDNEVGYRTAKI